VARRIKDNSRGNKGRGYNARMNQQMSQVGKSLLLVTVHHPDNDRTKADDITKTIDSNIFRPSQLKAAVVDVVVVFLNKQRCQILGFPKLKIAFPSEVLGASDKRSV